MDILNKFKKGDVVTEVFFDEIIRLFELDVTESVDRAKLAHAMETLVAERLKDINHKANVKKQRTKFMNTLCSRLV